MQINDSISVPKKIFDSIVTFFTKEAGLENSIAILFEYLKTIIPATHIICSWVDLEAAVWIPLVEMRMDNAPLSVGKKIAQIKPNNFLSLFNEDILIIDDYKEITEPILEGIHLPCRRSGLVLIVYRKNKTFISIGLGSTEKAAFTKEHACLLYLFRDSLAKLMTQYFITTPTGHINLVDSSALYQNSLILLQQCKGLSELMEEIKAISKTDQRIIIHGETGTGKEIVATAIHELSYRKNGPMIKVNCGAIPEHLVDSEFFGHEKGAFTGAVNTQLGYFEQASGGTLYLDEIAEMSLQTQVRLLRVLESNEIQRVGGQKSIKVNVRVVAATHRNLAKMVQEGTFREDLFYRLNVINLEVPPLRSRREDIPILVNYFCKKHASSAGFNEFPVIPSEEMTKLFIQPWYGNVRQLNNVVERALFQAMLHKTQTLSFEMLDHKEKEEQLIDTVKIDILTKEKFDFQTINRELIQNVLKQTNGIIQGPKGAAAILGVKPNTLRARMKKLGITL